MSPFYLIRMDTCHSANGREQWKYIFCLLRKVISENGARRSSKGGFLGKTSRSCRRGGPRTTRINEKLCVFAHGRIILGENAACACACAYLRARTHTQIGRSLLILVSKAEIFKRTSHVYIMYTYTRAALLAFATTRNNLWGFQ